jgi:hypothetical protein
MVASFLNCVLKGINQKSNWPSLNFPKLETDPRGKGLVRWDDCTRRVSFPYKQILSEGTVAVEWLFDVVCFLKTP